MFDAERWAAVPFGFWAVVMFVFGSMVGSFLNVCIYRMPLGLSVVSPPSHCPHCKYSIPWFLNVPLLTWVSLGGKCKNCRAPISPRYFLVELLTAVAFMGCWLRFGHESAWLALVYSLFLAGLIVATFIDFEHFIIPDEITIGGMVVGFVLSVLVPRLHCPPDAVSLADSIWQSLLGMGVGAGVIYAILRAGKLMFGRQKVALPANTSIDATVGIGPITGVTLPFVSKGGSSLVTSFICLGLLVSVATQRPNLIGNDPFHFNEDMGE